jgi:uncharacterized membrane protein YgcG
MKSNLTNRDLFLTKMVIILFYTEHNNPHSALQNVVQKITFFVKEGDRSFSGGDHSFSEGDRSFSEGDRSFSGGESLASRCAD